MIRIHCVSFPFASIIVSTAKIREGERQRRTSRLRNSKKQYGISYDDSFAQCNASWMMLIVRQVFRDNSSSNMGKCGLRPCVLTLPSRTANHQSHCLSACRWWQIDKYYHCSQIIQHQTLKLRTLSTSTHSKYFQLSTVEIRVCKYLTTF